MLKFIRLRKLKPLLRFRKSNFSQKAKFETKIVELPVGKVKGKHQIGITGHGFYSFEGIPYGKPPLGKLRFCLPQPAEPWCDKVLDCLEERDVPIQQEDREPGTVTTIGSEDCLYLNVFTKNFDSSKPLPVLVYIHGGGFKTGGATRTKYGPDYFMREDIVYVQFSYRLCVLGFLSMTNSKLGVPGNAGLHDTVLALRWIKEHISHFNGDSDNITIIGTSAGAGSVHFMMCLPEACGLFHRAVMMSGSMVCPWVHVPNTDTLSCRLANEKGYKGKMLEGPVLEFLRSLPAEELVRNTLCGSREFIFGHLYPFVPTLEHHDGSKGLLMRPFLQLMRDAWSKKVPLLIGGTSFEGLIMYPYSQLNNGHILNLLKEEPTLVLPHDLYRTLSVRDLNERAAQLVRFHFGPRQIHNSNIMQLLDLFSYKLFWHGMHRTVLSRLAFAEAPTYVYRFDFDSSQHNLMRINLCGSDIRRGVCHADELGYMFPRELKFKNELNEPECLTINRMVGILTAFAKTGNPNCVETQPEEWMPVTKKTPFHAMNISYDLTFDRQLEEEGLQMWNKLYDNDKRLLYDG